MSRENVGVPFPSRTELRGSPKTQVPTANEPSRAQWIGAGGVAALTGVLVTLLVSPSTTATAAADSSNEPSTATGSVPLSGEDSWADLASDSLQDTGDFAGTMTAASRARVRASVVVDSCLALPTAANGSRSFTEAERVYFPLREGTYTTSSPYGYRFSPFTGAYELHQGDDYAAPFGTPIHAVADGTVSFAGPRETYGYLTIIDHIDTDGTMIQSWYLHQAEGTQLVTVGQKVEAGEQIGSVGSTGNSTGPHLHLELHPAGGTETIDPSPWLQAHDAVFLGQECS
ncbi:M23 family metallopeptidase [Actinomycetaceae bacterium MB13-C1-2]|nr:M23 family metallopeptidase [Actinomycetaceae bacterium MB13-C1-2]